MLKPLSISYRHRGHLIHLRHILQVTRYNLKNNDLEYLNPTCVWCRKKTTAGQLYSISYGFKPQSDRFGEYKNLINLGYVCQKHLDHPNFDSWLFAFAKQKMSDLVDKFKSIQAYDSKTKFKRTQLKN